MGRTELHDAAQRGDYEACLKLVEVLRTDINAKDSSWVREPRRQIRSNIALICHAWSCRTILCPDNYILCAQYMYTALHFAAEADSAAIVSLLLDADANIHARSQVRAATLIW